MYFYIDGYWKDDGVEFSQYIVREYDDSVCNIPHALGLTDEDVFYYGLSEDDIKKSIENAGKEEDVLEFVITSYEIYK